MLTDLELLHDLSERSSVSGTVLSADADFLSSLSHFVLLDLIINNKKFNGSKHSFRFLHGFAKFDQYLNSVCSTLFDCER